MVEKNSFWRKLIAFIFSVIVLGLVVPTIFSIPLEFVVMNADTYSDLIQDDEILTVGQEAFSAYIAQQLSQPADNQSIPVIFSDPELLADVIQPFVTKEWVSMRLTDVVSQLLEFLNFKQPHGILRVDLTALKENMLTQREIIIGNILANFAPCDDSEIKLLISGDLTISSIPRCNPPANIQDNVIQAISVYVEDYIYQLPQEYRLDIEQFINPDTQNTVVNYSIARWTIRLLPVLTLVVLILLAVLLRKNGNEMRRWMGRLLVTAGVVSIILIIILLIGSEQFTAVFINQNLSSDQEAFASLLLMVLQAVTYRTLLWMGVIAIGILCIGLLILFFNKLGSKPKIKSEEIDEELTSSEDMLEGKKAMIAESFREEAQEGKESEE